MAVKLNTETINKRMSELYNGEYELITEYINNSSGGTLRHKICGHEFKLSRLTRFFNESNNCPCPQCRVVPSVSKTKVTIDDFNERLKNAYGNLFTTISFVKMHAPVTLKCNNCGNIITPQAKDLFSKNRFNGCPNCVISKRGKHQSDPNYLQNALNEAPDGNEYQWLEAFKGSPKENHKIKHLTCGHEYFVKPTNFRYGDKTRCPKCARKRSKSECAMFSEILKFCPNAISSDRSQINPYELDIYVPDKKIAIEYNGLHWHSEKIKGKNYHKEKMELCNKKGIRLIQIFEDEWLNKQDIVLSKIKNILGLQSVKAIYARKCICKKIENASEYMDFLNKNHIQGAVSLSVAYGLYYNGVLVALGGFNKLRNSMNNKNVSNAWDMIRYAADIDYNIVGGCSKIISTFVNNEKCEYIKTLADLRWSSSKNNMYIKLGFSESNKVPPRYFYTNGKERFPRFGFRKDKIKEKFPEIYDSNLTEFEMMDRTYYERIWDAGKITYEKYF